MRLFLRIVSVGVTLVSLLSCVGLIALWIRSYNGADYVSRTWLTGADAMTTRNETQRLSVTRGQIRFTIEQNTYYHHGAVDISKLKPGPRPSEWCRGRFGPRYVSEEAPERTFWERRGFAAWEWGWSSSFADSRDRNWSVPVWPVVVLLALLPAIRPVWPVVVLLGYGAGRCAACGYDLRATPERCPECGAVPVGAR
jgi:hypothetical protein